MLKFLKHLAKDELKKDVRKLGINLVTAGVVGMFINRVSDLSVLGSGLIFTAFAIGMALMLSGLYNDMGES